MITYTGVLTVDAVTRAVRAWLDVHVVLPRVAVVIIEGQLEDGTRVAVGFNPNLYGTDPPSHPALVYRLDRIRAGKQYMAMTPATPEFVRALGFDTVHRSTVRILNRGETGP